jgi:membrane protease YdiL (CAAX protease family)
MDDRVAGWILALALSVMLIFVADRGGRQDALGLVALMLLYVVALAASAGLLAPDWRAWAPAIAGAAVWLAVQPLLGLGRLSRREIGLAAPQPGSVRPALIVTIVVLALNALIITARRPVAIELSLALLAAVVLAAIVEEFVMRGVLLALADRASAPRWQIAGAAIGRGGIVVTLAFVALHGIRPGLLLGVLPAAVLYLWLRARTGSLLAPIVAHVGWNLSVVLLHR